MSEETLPLASTIQKISETLKKHGPLTAAKLAMHIRLNEKTIGVALKTMHDKKMIHVVAYDTDIRKPARMWKLGPGRDVGRFERQVFRNEFETLFYGNMPPTATVEDEYSVLNEESKA